MDVKKSYPRRRAASLEKTADDVQLNSRRHLASSFDSSFLFLFSGLTGSIKTVSTYYSVCVAIEKSSTGWLGDYYILQQKEKEVMEKTRGGHLQLAVVLVFVGAFHVPTAS